MNIDIMEMVRVFAVGGGICVIGQLLLDFTNLNAPKILVLFVAAGGILTALGLYQSLVDFAGSGATVPLPGFGYSLVRGVLEEACSAMLSGFFRELREKKKKEKEAKKRLF